MPKKRQIPYLTEVRGKTGTSWHWKPSPRLRALGWTNLKLGTDRKRAILLAEERNEELVRWMASRGKGIPLVKAPPERMTFGKLVQRYKEDTRWTELRPKTQAEYKSRLAMLSSWAQNGNLLVRDIDREMVLDLRRELLKHPSRHRTAAILRVLGIIMQYAEDERLIVANPAHKLNIPEPRPRTRRIMRDELHWLLDACAAVEAGGGGPMEHIATGIILGFFTMQREGDLLAVTQFQAQPLRDVSPEARRVLAGPDGEVWGINLFQQKTNVAVGIPFHPAARDAVMGSIGDRGAAGRLCTNLIRYPGEDRLCPEWRFQRDFAKVRAAAVDAARGADDNAMVERLTGLQFRDLRRSGMCWMRDLGVSIGGIASLSGHSIKQTQKILDTYMPADTRGAADAMAMAVAREAELDALNSEKQA